MWCGEEAVAPSMEMVCHYGEYLGTATAEPYGFFPSVERINGNEIQCLAAGGIKVHLADNAQTVVLCSLRRRHTARGF